MKIKPNAFSEEIEVDVDYDYEPEEPMVWTYSNGDPGHPGSPEMVYLTSVKHNDIEIISYLSDEMIAEIEDRIIKERKSYED